jgi:hypothetical protein
MPYVRRQDGYGTASTGSGNVPDVEGMRQIGQAAFASGVERRF